MIRRNIIAALLGLAMIVNLNSILNPNHIELFKSIDPELIVHGGSGAGKSYSIVDKFLLRAARSKKKLKLVALRKTLPSIKKNVIPIIEERSKAFGLRFSINKNEMVGRVKNLEIVFQSLNNTDDREKLQGLTNLDYVWFNELTELREADYEEALRRLRGGNSKHEQIISDFNPIGTHSWVFKRFFEKNIGNVKKLRYTVLDNHPNFLNTDKGQRYVERLKVLKDRDMNLYKIYFLGEWGEVVGVIFSWDIVPLPDIAFDEVFYGGDFGFSVDPATVVRIYRKADEFWIEELFYETGLTNQDIAWKLKHEHGFTRKEQTYWDSQEPKSIQEICNEGLIAMPAIKGPDSVRAGIDFLRTKKIHIVDNSPNIIKERASYVWRKDKDGRSLKEPVKFMDHAIDATRYGIYTHLRDAVGGFAEETDYTIG